MLKYYLAILFSIVFLILPSRSAQDTVIIGVDVIAVSDILLTADQYSIEFQIWLKYKNDSLDIFNSIWIQNAESFSKEFIRKEKIGDINWATARCKATVNYDWDLKDFPFVSQEVNLRIFDVMRDSKKMVFIADSVDSKLNDRFHLTNWNISSFSFFTRNIESGSKFGYPGSENLSFPAGIVRFNLERKSPFLVIEKILLPVWVAFLVALVVFWIKPVNVDPRFGLPAAGMFASVANKYLISDITIGLPYQIYVETIHNHTFFAILLIIILSVYSLYLYEKDEVKQYKRVDKRSFFVILIAYILDNIYQLYHAFSQAS